MRKLVALLTVAAAGVLASFTGAASSIKVGDNYFVRPTGVPTVNAKKGAKVTFRFVGHFDHLVSVKSGPSKFKSKAMTTGSFKSPALKKGTYLIICTLHGQSDQSMKLKVS
jgi:plastocyanin